MSKVFYQLYIKLNISNLFHFNFADYDLHTYSEILSQYFEISFQFFDGMIETCSIL